MLCFLNQAKLDETNVCEPKRAVNFNSDQLMRAKRAVNFNSDQLMRAQASRKF